MAMVKIGHSEVMSTPLGLGTNAVGGHNLFPNLDEEEGKKVVQTALDNQINLLDTAFSYGMGRSEELIGEVIQSYNREKIVIATKAAQDPKADGKINNSPTFLTQAVDHALKRLKTDYIDIFYIHFPDKTTPKVEAIDALQRLKENGKIRAIGLSNFNLAQIKEANQEGHVDIIENQYNLLHRDAEKDIMPYLKENQMSFIPYFPLASGLLTGKYTEIVTFPKNDLRSKNPDFQGARFRAIITTVNQLKKLADEHQATIAEIVLAWYIKNPAISVVIPGAKKVKQVLANVKSLTVQLSNEEYQFIDSLFQA
ncbi:aldo/keto reductase [Melissococcus plutonius]|uniref:Oxidoreductase ion channel n=1 Tax=Melissococcus plutonius TaxID=33970 RepID=A0A2Z5Y1U2_9ENTE|nr:aldo/keto reductase [Melissococcus plutonius]MCV2499331.1 aldo/keto reductase [Melissococcus plutonius]MCV2500974.1 aldo/keto reductase [Melissococcus plutonius]MCV2505598.1 aldo/keto reductase [Melissococcus plutonius]MCV2507905.1 aldo/keto reductase [Melissococcus plutonius]MCV2520341.1 aldo/keto reductase [Melissococcus plutonius]